VAHSKGSGKKAQSASQLELLRIIRELMEQRGGACVVSDVYDEAVVIWKKRHEEGHEPLHAR
jgi:hypothetical protein